MTGKSKKYITGSGQSVPTFRRVQMYQRESGVFPKSRPPRIKEIANILLSEDVLNGDAVDNVVEYLSDSHSSEVFTVQSYSFSHPMEASVRVDAVEVSTSNGANVVTSVSMCRGPNGDQCGFEISRSISLATLPPDNNNDQTSKSCEDDIDDMLMDLFGEINVAPSFMGFDSSYQTYQESYGLVRELSYCLAPSEADQVPDFDSWVKGLQCASFNFIRSTSLGIIGNDSMRLRSFDCQQGEGSQHTISLANGFSSEVTVRSFSFYGPDESANDFPGNISCSMKPLSSFVESDNDIKNVSLPSSLKRDRDDDNLDSSSRKISKKDWDDLLHFNS